MDKQSVVYSCYGKLLSNKKEENMNIDDNIDTSQKYYAKRKKSNTNTIYWMSLFISNSITYKTTMIESRPMPGTSARVDD